jgi:hypothetical protein
MATSSSVADVAFWPEPASRTGSARPLCPGVSDIHLFRYCEGVVDLNPKVSDCAFNLGMPERGKRCFEVNFLILTLSASLMVL